MRPFSAAVMDRSRDELAWLAFYVPRFGVQWLSTHLPLAAIRDRLPVAVSTRLKLGLTPARITAPRSLACARDHAAWGSPPDVDRTRAVTLTSVPRVSIIMVTYNNLELTRLCLASLQRANGSIPYELIVADNASTDGTLAYLDTVRDVLPLRVTTSDSNRGFSAANNRAAAMARGELLVFLNNDTVVVPGWLERLIAHLDRDPTIGIIGPVTNSCGNEAEIATPYSVLTGMALFAEEYTRAHAGECRESPMVTLFCAAMPRKLFADIGGLDEGYGIGMFEDDDLCMKIRARGLRPVVAEDVFVHHYGGATFAKLAPSKYLRIWWTNRRRFERRWGRWERR